MRVTPPGRACQGQRVPDANSVASTDRRQSQRGARRVLETRSPSRQTRPYAGAHGQMLWGYAGINSIA